MDVIHKPFEPKKSEHPLTDRTTVELNTERGAKEREEYDDKIKAKHADLEELKRQRDEKQKTDEMEEVARFRKDSVHKALFIYHTNFTINTFLYNFVTVVV